jgi:hypothetical protein
MRFKHTLGDVPTTVVNHLLRAIVDDKMAITLVDLCYSNGCRAKPYFQDTSKADLDTRHFISFDPINALVRILPFNFTNDVHPKSRFNELFPDGYASQIIGKNDDYCVTSDVISDRNSNDSAFTWKNESFYGCPIVGSFQIFDDGINLQSLNMQQILEFINSIEISENYDYLAFYPPC